MPVVYALPDEHNGQDIPLTRRKLIMQQSVMTNNVAWYRGEWNTYMWKPECHDLHCASESQSYLLHGSVPLYTFWMSQIIIGRMYTKFRLFEGLWAIFNVRKIMLQHKKSFNYTKISISLSAIIKEIQQQKITIKKVIRGTEQTESEFGNQYNFQVDDQQSTFKLSSAWVWIPPESSWINTCSCL